MVVDAALVHGQEAALIEDEDQLLSLEHAAKYMDVSVHQVRRFCQSQGLTIVRLGPKLIRLRKGDIKAFISSHRGPWDKAS